MDYQIQKFKAPKFIHFESKCILEIENFGNYTLGENISSANVDFAEVNFQWAAKTTPNVNELKSSFEFQINLSSEALAKSKKFQYRVSGTAGPNQLFKTNFEIIDQLKVIKTQWHDRPTITNTQSKSGWVVITLQLEIGCWTDLATSQQTLSATKCRLHLVYQYSNLLNDSTFSDFTFVVKGKNFKVHKSILASESETMRAMFTTQFRESIEAECKVDDIEPDIFQCMLQFIYAGIIPAKLDDVAMDLYKAAHYYRIVNLMEVCKRNIHVRLTDCNALDVYELSTMYDIEDLKIDAWKIVKCQILKIGFPLKNEPLPMEDVRAILNIKKEEQEFWLKHRKQTITTTVKKSP